MKTIELNNNQSLIIKALVNTDNYYAEPGYSDVSPQDIYKMVEADMTKEAAKRALSALYNKGILYTDTFQGDSGRKTTIVYLNECIWHMIGWDVNAYGLLEVEEVEFVYTDKPERIKDTNPTGPRGPLAELTETILNIKEDGNVTKAIDIAMGKTDLKNAKTAMAKFIKSNRVRARYYGITITKYDHTL